MYVLTIVLAIFSFITKASYLSPNAADKFFVSNSQVLRAKGAFNFVRALAAPGPSATATINSATVKINKVELVSGAPVYKGIPGAILAKEGDYFLVKTGDSYVRLIEWSSTERLKAGGRFQ